MDGSTLRAAVRRVIGEMSPLGQRQADSGDRLIEDLGYDSLAMIELSLRMEQEFSLQAAQPEETLGIKTVKDLEDFVEQNAGTPADAG
jgi:acyl carrier protein